MKLVFNMSEISEMVVDYLTEKGTLSDDDSDVKVTWSIDRYNGAKSVLVVEELK